MLEAGHGEVVCGEPEDTEGEGKAGGEDYAEVGALALGHWC